MGLSIRSVLVTALLIGFSLALLGAQHAYAAD